MPRAEDDAPRSRLATAWAACFEREPATFALGLRLTTIAVALWLSLEVDLRWAMLPKGEVVSVAGLVVPGAWWSAPAALWAGRAALWAGALLWLHGRLLPVLEALHREHAAAGLVVVGVSVDEQQADAEAFLKQVSLSFPIVFDADRSLGKAWSPPKMPSVFLIERDGTIARVFAGEKPGQLDELRAELVRRLADAPPA